MSAGSQRIRGDLRKLHAAVKGSFILFGYVLVNKPELKIREFETYRSYYCGLCHALKELRDI